MSEKENLKRLARLIDGRQAWSEIPADEHWEIIHLARFHHVFPLLYRAMETGDAHANGILPELNIEVLQHKARSLLLAKTAAEVKQVLTRVEIPTLWFKGLALAYTIYPAPWLRCMGDIDVLVPDEQSEFALTQLIQAGFVNQFYETLGLQLHDIKAHKELVHHFTLFSKMKDAMVELHYDLSIRRISQLDVSILDWFWEHAHTVHTQQFGDLLVLDHESELLLVAIHDIVQHQNLADQRNEVPGGFGLSRKYDLHLLVGQDGLDWDMVFRQAKTFGWLDPFWIAIKQTHDYFGTPTNLDALERELQTIYHITYRNPLQDLVSLKTYRVAWRFFWHLSLHDKASFIWNRILFIPEADIREIYGLSETQRVWSYHIRRIIQKTFSVFRLAITLTVAQIKQKVKRDDDE
ncbi:MAG: nucleotidyltransferase family protein [Anaerolineae bacterium]|nr:nucleotidyltransferase family protein [Anaerolineae bacterium]